MIVATGSMFILTAVTGNLKTLINKENTKLKQGLLFMTAGTFFGPVIGVSLAMYTVSLVDASVAQTIFSLVPVFVLPIAYFIFKEKVTGASIIGALIAILGVVILIWRDAIMLKFS
jgi:drug/metabolite transporter (DMT)-like permease